MSTNTPQAAAFPAIYKAALEIAYDNGGINRGRSEKEHRADLAKFLSTHDSEVLRPIDAWLKTLSDDEMMTVCAGEESDQQRALVGSPMFTDDLLNQIFEEVC